MLFMRKVTREDVVREFHNIQHELRRLTMLTQQALDTLTARLKALEPGIAQIAAADQPPVDATALTNEISTIESAVNTATAALNPGSGTAAGQSGQQG